MHKTSNNHHFTDLTHSNKQRSQADQKSTPIPITVQKRSKSEPKLDLDSNEDNEHIYDSKHHINTITVPVNYNTTTTSPKSRVTFHKYDSNEIIAVVNVPDAYETTTIGSAVNRQHDSYQSQNSSFKSSPKYSQANRGPYNKSHSKSVPNLAEEHTMRSKLDTWRQWPEYTVEQDTDSSIMSNETNNWIKESAYVDPRIMKPNCTEGNKVIFRNTLNKHIRRDKPHNYEFEIEIEKQMSPRRVAPTRSNKTTLNIETKPSKSNILIESVAYMPGKNNTGRYSTTSMVNNTNINIITNEQETTSTRMSSGYFSGDEFRSYYSNYIDMMPNSSFTTTTTTTNVNSPTLSSSTDTTASNQFNIRKFLNKESLNRTRQKNDIAFDEFNKLYKSIGLEEDEALLDRANARDHPLYNQNLERSRRSHSYSSMNPIHAKTSIKTVILDEDDEDNYRRSIYSRKSAVPDARKDDMARRTHTRANNLSSMSVSRLEREIEANQAYLDRSPIYFYSGKTHGERGLERDDASVINTNRKRSNSLTSLNNNADTISSQLLILPSPTSADYLRNRTRESALINVVMNPAKTSTDFEISQILYDDMAYRQLRKDSDACKLTQLKSNSGNLLPNNFVNITTLPMGYASSASSKSPNYNDYYQNTFNANRSNDPGVETRKSYINDMAAGSNSNVKTVKMIKQKDASNKNLRQNINVKNSNFSHTETMAMANR